ncbi:hypothetical protein [Aureispira anguillae]|uniref:Uncharacterized protein n=1 Tax=Aureispira anguillae TaxID=2864201 RepID=A0A916DUK2_9BACT|nr:hypothetical protein [Aureispira anguillae]BDS12762.1 hypothetical protein AsAng_0034870 [Aureispira anguillae]
MNKEKRQALLEEWQTLKDQLKDSRFIDPSVIRRLDEIHSLLITEGKSAGVRWEFKRGDYYRKGLKINQPYNRKGEVG